jgi:hypothetical protein
MHGLPEARHPAHSPSSPHDIEQQSPSATHARPFATHAEQLLPMHVLLQQSDPAPQLDPIAPHVIAASTDASSGAASSTCACASAACSSLASASLATALVRPPFSSASDGAVIEQRVADIASSAQTTTALHVRAIRPLLAALADANASLSRMGCTARASALARIFGPESEARRSIEKIARHEDSALPDLRSAKAPRRAALLWRASANSSSPLSHARTAQRTTRAEISPHTFRLGVEVAHEGDGPRGGETCRLGLDASSAGGTPSVRESGAAASARSTSPST